MLTSSASRRPAFGSIGRRIDAAVGENGLQATGTRAEVLGPGSVRSMSEGFGFELAQASSYNVGGDGPLSISGLARGVVRALDAGSRVHTLCAPENGREPGRRVPDVARARAEFDLSAPIALDDALVRTPGRHRASGTAATNAAGHSANQGTRTMNAPTFARPLNDANGLERAAR